ncbi:MAG: hypothetical protein LDL12_00345 [Anaerolinea sp.]|nr:hypothetical protein [Anaerolinea sp.]
MTLPAVVLGLVIGSFLGILYHLWRGGEIWRLLLYMALGCLGFWVGHFLGAALGWTFAAYGPLNIGMGVFVGAITIFLGHWLSLVQVEKK